MTDLRSGYRYPHNTDITAKQVAQLAHDLLDTTWEFITPHDSYSINIAQLDWVFRWNNKLSKAIGRCVYSYKTIELSAKIFMMNTNKSHEIENTIRHEIAHALDSLTRGRSGHDYEWQSIARQVLANPSATSRKFTHDTSKYVAECPVCGHVYGIDKQPTHNVSCGRCSKAYDASKLLTYKLRETTPQPAVKKTQQDTTEFNGLKVGDKINHPKHGIGIITAFRYDKNYKGGSIYGPNVKFDNWKMDMSQKVALENKVE